MGTLVFYKEERVLFEYRLSSVRTTIGRSDSCDVALPGEGVSRLHCWIEHRQNKYFLVDKSKHGTFVNKQRVSRKEIQIGKSFHLAEYRISLREQEIDPASTVEVLPKRPHEFIFASDQKCLINRATLIISQGVNIGKKHPLKKSVITIGGPGSDIRIQDPLLQPNHCRIRVSRGRTMVEPGSGPVFLGGQRVFSITPIYSDEEVCIGGSSFRIESKPSIEEPEAKSFGKLIGSSIVMQKIFGQLKLFAGHDFPVLINGESGTGKELAAKGIHQASFRSTGPFVALNCGAIPTNLIESELFGHEKGAFSGALSKRDGAFQQADGGTLFLDELGELPLAAQVKLLRVLENGEVRRVGSSKVEYPNVRIIAATNKSLPELVSKGSFREDLFFRLYVLSIQLPPLRDRKEDISLIAKELCKHLHPECRISSEVELLLKQHHWPGNVRELRNVLARGFVLGGTHISQNDIELYSLPASPYSFNAETEEVTYLRNLMQKHKGNRSSMARELGLPRTTLLYKLQRLGLVESK
jgi:transcriptional regulator with AAA-type ATPase domain